MSKDVKDMTDLINNQSENMNPCLILAFCYNRGLLSVGFKGSCGLNIRLISVVSAVQLRPPLPSKQRGYGIFRSLFFVLNPCLILAFFRFFSSTPKSSKFRQLSKTIKNPADHTDCNQYSPYGLQASKVNNYG